MATEMSKRIDKIVKAGFASILVKLEFKKRGTNFILERNDVTWIVNIQRSRWNSKEDSSFTVNAGVRVEGVVEAYCARSEPSSHDISSCCVSVRIKHPPNSRGGCWWNVSATDESPIVHDEAIVRELIDATDGMFERFLRKLDSRKQVADFLAGRISIDYQPIAPRTAAQRHVYASLVYKGLGDQEAARNEITLAIVEAKGSPIEEFVERVRENCF